jgi:RNA polymerase sigma factor for flagellar operon FliA
MPATLKDSAPSPRADVTPRRRALAPPCTPSSHRFGRDDSDTHHHQPPPAARVPHSLPLPDLWRRFQQEGSVSARDRLVDHYMRTHVKPIAERIRSSLPRHIDIDDLFQVGYLGLIDAMRRFDPQRRIKFETFSRPRIFGAIRDHLRAMDPMPRLTRLKMKAVEAIIDRFLVDHGRLPSELELETMIDVPPAMARQLLGMHSTGATVSFSSGAGDGSEPDDGDALGSLPDHRFGSPTRRAARDDLKWWIIRGFSPRDRLVLILYYYEQMTMREIGLVIGWSESRVSQRLDAILKCLRARLCHDLDTVHEFLFE